MNVALKLDALKMKADLFEGDEKQSKSKHTQKSFLKAIISLDIAK